MSGTPLVPDMLKQDNARAIVWMVAAMALFAIEDALIKVLTTTLGVGQILFVLATGGAIVFSIITKRNGSKLLTADVFQRAVIMRNIGEVFGTLGILMALALIPLSVASSILQATPLVVTMGAALFLGERVGWRRWTAVLIGFFGVLLIIRPGATDFDPNALFAVVAVIGLAVRDLATRRLPSRLSSMQISAYAYWALVPPALALMLFQGGWQPVGGAMGSILAVGILLGVGAYYILTHALRIGDLSAIAPFRYSRLVFSLIIAMTFFGERPDTLMLLGAAIIIATGLYALYRERVRKAAKT